MMVELSNDLRVVEYVVNSKLRKWHDKMLDVA